MPLANRTRNLVTCASLSLVAALASGCSPIQRSSALLGLGVATCGGGKAATAADEDWGALLSEAGCWLADWAAERLDAQREAERERIEVATATEHAHALTELDAAAVELAEAHALMVAEPCEANAEKLGQALERCRSLAQPEQSEPIPHRKW
jgi:hypothetical protein